jgi:Tfp pilus assembly protein PilO
MVLSKRERYIGIIAGSVLAILVLDHFFLTPMMDRQDELDAKIKLASNEVRQSTGQVQTGRRARDVWNSMNRETLLRDDSDAESQMLNSVREWGQEAGLSISSQKRERTEPEGDFVKITYRVTATGGVSQVSRFLYRVQNANVPVRVTDVSINTRKDGTDDLQVSLGLATIYLSPQQQDRNAPGGGGGGTRTASASWQEAYR